MTSDVKIAHKRRICTELVRVAPNKCVARTKYSTLKARHQAKLL